MVTPAAKPKKKPVKSEPPAEESVKQAAAKHTEKAKKHPPAARPKPAKKKKKKAPPKTPGRKPWIPDYDMIEKYAALGLLDKEIAALSGICHEEFSRKKTQFPQLFETLEKGRAKGVQIATMKMWEHVNKGDKDMTKFFLERRGNYKLTMQLDPPGKRIEDMTPEELLAIINGKPIS